MNKFSFKVKSLLFSCLWQGIGRERVVGEVMLMDLFSDMTAILNSIASNGSYGMVMWTAV